MPILRKVGQFLTAVDSEQRSITKYYSLTIQDAKRIQTWSQIVFGADDSIIRLAVRRVLSALSERIDSEDGFVDVVIAWENLFNNSRIDVTKNISKSISELLGASNKERKKLRSIVIHYYNKRCDVVHGTAGLTLEEAMSCRIEVLAMTLDVFRILYKNIPELLSDTQRSATIALMDTDKIKHVINSG